MSFLDSLSKLVRKMQKLNHIPDGFSNPPVQAAAVARTLVDSTGAAQKMGFITGLGDGGAVTQITNSATGVTLNKVVGQITTVALTTAAAAQEVFTVTNSKVAAKDIVAVSTTYAGAGTIMVGTKKVTAGTFDVTITNLHASAALNAVVVINFAVIKGATN